MKQGFLVQSLGGEERKNTDLSEGSMGSMLDSPSFIVTSGFCAGQHLEWSVVRAHCFFDGWEIGGPIRYNYTNMDPN